ncbi:hypothetical protein FRB90_006340 [Tulasnella sp. 427]|nr:hypothetical protein FRB90_006340 [Tulasnella sp. 427]
MARASLALRNRSNSYDTPTQCRPSRNVEVEDDICALSETISRVSFYPSPATPPEDEQYTSETSTLRRPLDDCGLQLRSTPSSGLSISHRRTAYTFEDIDSGPSYAPRTSPESPSAIPSMPDEEDCENDEWSSGSDGSGDEVDGMFTMVSLDEVAFPSLNSSMYTSEPPEESYYVEESRGRPDHSKHHRYYAEDDYSQPSESEHYTQRSNDAQRGSGPSWAQAISYTAYLAYIKTRAEEAQRREAEKMLLRYQMAVAEAILNRTRRHPRRRPYLRVLLARDAPERAYVHSPLRMEIPCS